MVEILCIFVEEKRCHNPSESNVFGVILENCAVAAVVLVRTITTLADNQKLMGHDSL